MMFKVMVTGSRAYTDYNTILAAFTRITDKHGKCLLIHGAARGADTLAARAAAQLGWDIEPHPVTNWRNADGSVNRAAGHQRNARMLDREPDGVIAFFQPGEKNAGTRGAATNAQKRGIQLVCFYGAERKSLEDIVKLLPMK